MESLKIVGLCVAAAVVYGIVQDQITARVCIEYFTVGHPPVFDTEDPTLLALGWGVIATWWVGVLLGVPAALVARAGLRPKLTARKLIKPIGILMVSLACFALLSGAIGYVWSSTLLGYDQRMASALPPGKYEVFMADAWAHGAAYLGGAVGGTALMIWMWRERGASTCETQAADSFQLRNESPPGIV